MTQDIVVQLFKEIGKWECVMSEDQKCPICPKCEQEYNNANFKEKINVCPNCETMEMLKIYAKHLVQGK